MEFLTPQTVAPDVPMLLLLWAGESKMAKSSGESETHGAQDGVIKAMARLQSLRALECVVYINTQPTLLFERTLYKRSN